jgi:hypothetical protein
MQRLAGPARPLRRVGATRAESCFPICSAGNRAKIPAFAGMTGSTLTLTISDF